MGPLRSKRGVRLMAGFTPVNVAGNYLAGRAAAQDHQYGERRNALADQQLQQNQQRMQMQQQQLTEEQQRAVATKMMQTAQWALQSPSPKRFVEQNAPELAQAAGPDWATADDNTVRMQLQDLIGKFGPQAGVAPAPRPAKWEERKGPRGSIIQVNPETGEQKQVVGPDNSQPAAAAPKRFRAMTPAEIAAYQLPAGSAAQINDETGQIQVLNKPSVAPQQTAAERKAVLEAKVKLPRVNAAMRRADRLSQAVASIGKNSFLDGGPSDAKVLQYTEQGRELMASAAQLMPELQALTRVPGIGSQSDLEARLASLALPSLEMDPDTNQRSMAELQAFIQDLKAAYETMATGGVATGVPDEAGPAAVTPAASGWSIKAL
jgi:hypothetical protein